MASALHPGCRSGAAAVTASPSSSSSPSSAAAAVATNRRGSEWPNTRRRRAGTPGRADGASPMRRGTDDRTAPRAAALAPLRFKLAREEQATPIRVHYPSRRSESTIRVADPRSPIRGRAAIREWNLGRGGAVRDTRRAAESGIRVTPSHYPSHSESRDPRGRHIRMARARPGPARPGE